MPFPIKLLGQFGPEADRIDERAMVEFLVLLEAADVRVRRDGRVGMEELVADVSFVDVLEM